MCMSYETTCNCGGSLAGFNFKDEVMSDEVISRLYCPKCSTNISFTPETMLADNGWIIEYDMDIAGFQAQKIKSASAGITPEFLFDEGYCTWQGVYPSDHIDSASERVELSKLAKVNPKQYFESLKQWANTRMDRLAKEGWRKAAERRVAA